MRVESITKAENITKVGNIINNQPRAAFFCWDKAAA